MSDLCPHCGYYCTNKTVFCTPPIVEREVEVMTIEEIRKVFIDYGDVSQEHIKILFAEIDRLTQVLKLEEQRNAARLGVNDRLIRKNTELEAEIDYLRKRLNRAVDIAESLNLDEPDKHTYIDMVAELQQIGKEVQQ